MLPPAPAHQRWPGNVVSSTATFYAALTGMHYCLMTVRFAASSAPLLPSAVGLAGYVVAFRHARTKHPLTPLPHSVGLASAAACRVGLDERRCVERDVARGAQGAALFGLLGGRLRSVCPSDVVAVGAFAKRFDKNGK